MAQTPVGIVTTASTGMETDLLSIAAIGLGIGAALFAVRKGWRVLTGFVR